MKSLKKWLELDEMEVRESGRFIFDKLRKNLAKSKIFQFLDFLTKSRSYI